jgi:hypothetical protein
MNPKKESIWDLFVGRESLTDRHMTSIWHHFESEMIWELIEYLISFKQIY